MKRCVAGLLFAVLVFGQPAKRATLSGKVTDSITHQPIEGAMVSFGGQQASAISDANGEWMLHFDADGSESIMEVYKNGYATEGLRLRVKPGAVETRDYELRRGATISGHLVDRDTGAPLVGFSVRAMPRLDDTGDHFYFGGTPAGPSGADGSFSIANLNPGDYPIEIEPPTEGRIYAGERKTDGAGYAPTWFPDVPRLEMAVPVKVASGENRRIEVRLQKRELRRIDGSIQIPEGMERAGISITLRGEAIHITGEIPRAGLFHIDGLQEGSYTLFAVTMASPRQSHGFVTRTIELTDRDVDDLNLTMQTGIALRAVVTMAEDKAVAPADIRFDPLFMDAPEWTMGVSDQGAERMDRFGVADLPPGSYMPVLENVPAGYAVSSVSYNGQPVPVSAAIDVEAAESDVTYVLTTRTGGVTGTVRDADQKPVPGAAVWILPPALPDTIGRFSFMARGQGGMAEADGNGAFQVGGLAPGRYKAVAIKGQGRNLPNMLSLRDHLDSADAVVVEAGQAASLDVRVIP